MMILLGGVVAIALAMALDPLAYAHLVKPDVYEHDGGRLLRVMGYLPTWIAVAAALVLHDRSRPAWWARGGLLLGAVSVAGLVGEVVKLAVRRRRPGPLDASYTFRPWSDQPLYSGGLGMPSSHAIVAFAAAALLSRLFPRARAVFYLMAVGCAVTRVQARAHFLSDVVVAAVLAWITVALLWSRFEALGLEPTREHPMREKT